MKRRNFLRALPAVGSLPIIISSAADNVLVQMPNKETILNPNQQEGILALSKNINWTKFDEQPMTVGQMVEFNRTWDECWDKMMRNVHASYKDLS